MIGEAYFDLRTRLGNELRRLAAAVRETGGSAEDIHIMDNLIAGLAEPFVFVVVGEVNVGKSTFLNALFGADFSKTGVVPTTDKVLFFKHGSSVQTVPISPTVDEVRVPCDFLKDFHIVDTPGTNSVEGEHQQITERFVPAADLVVFVFSALNPWGASAWQFLEKVHRQWMRHVILVLQQCDLRTEEEIAVISDYMRQLTRQRFSRDFPLFPVSARKAYLARSSGLDREKLLIESGYPPLEAHISDVVTRQPARMTKLAASLRLARQVLDQLIERTNQTLYSLGHQRQLISELQAERNVLVERTKAKFDLTVEASDFDLREAAGRIVGLIESGLSVRAAFQAVREDKRIPSNLDHRLNQELLAKTGERWQQMGQVLEEDFKRFENYLAHHWKGELYLGDLQRQQDDTESASQETRRRFMAKIESALRRFVLSLNMHEALEPGLKRSRKLAARLPWVAGIGMALAGVVGYFLGWMAGGLAAVLALLLTLVLFLSLRGALNRTRDRIVIHFEHARATLQQLLHQQVHDETEHAFGIFTRVLEPSKRDTELRETQVRDHASRLYELQHALQTLAQELQGSAPSA